MLIISRIAKIVRIVAETIFHKEKILTAINKDKFAKTLQSFCNVTQLANGHYNSRRTGKVILAVSDSSFEYSSFHVKRDPQTKNETKHPV